MSSRFEKIKFYFRTSRNGRFADALMLCISHILCNCSAEVPDSPLIPQYYLLIPTFPNLM